MKQRIGPKPLMSSLGAIALSGIVLFATTGCGTSKAPSAGTTPSPSKTPSPSVTPLALPSDPAITPTLAPGWGAEMTVQRSGAGSTVINTGMTKRTRELDVIVKCSGSLPFYFTDARGLTRMAVGSPKAKSGQCSDFATGGYRFKATAADRTIRLTTTPTTRWVIQVWAIEKPPVVNVP